MIIKYQNKPAILLSNFDIHGYYQYHNRKSETKEQEIIYRINVILLENKQIIYCRSSSDIFNSKEFLFVGTNPFVGKHNFYYNWPIPINYYHKQSNHLGYLGIDQNSSLMFFIGSYKYSQGIRHNEDGPAIVDLFDKNKSKYYVNGFHCENEKIYKEKLSEYLKPKDFFR